MSNLHVNEHKEKDVDLHGENDTQPTEIGAGLLTEATQNERTNTPASPEIGSPAPGSHPSVAPYWEETSDPDATASAVAGTPDLDPVRIPHQLRRPDLRFILVPPGKKKAMEIAWESECNYPFDHVTLALHLERGGNYGVLLPSRSPIVVIDADDYSRLVELGVSEIFGETFESRAVRAQLSSRNGTSTLRSTASRWSAVMPSPTPSPDATSAGCMPNTLTALRGSSSAPVRSAKRARDTGSSATSRSRAPRERHGTGSHPRSGGEKKTPKLHPCPGPNQRRMVRSDRRSGSR